MADVVRIIIEWETPTRRIAFEFHGREAWALATLIEAGESGVTPIERPAPRWSDYVFKLRAAGLDIETVHQRHGGPYAGRHGRYVLRSAAGHRADHGRHGPVSPREAQGRGFGRARPPQP